MTSNCELIMFIKAEIAGRAIQQMPPLDGTWQEKSHGWDSSFEYRLKPEPRVRWVNDYKADGLWSNLYKSEAEAKASAGPVPDVTQVKFIEVLNE